jgi:galactoside O-acetyltransferase
VRNWYAGVKDWSRVDIAPVEIGPRSWLGFNVGILRGVKIGEGAVVGAGSIVTRDVPPWCIVAGNPAKVIREISIEER